jgi:hypothetical protein
VEVIRDVEQDVQNAQQVARQSEAKRSELQIHINQTSVAIQERAVDNQKFQDSVIAENKQLQEEMQKMRELLVAKEKEKMDVKAQLEKEKMDQQLRYEA